VATDQPSEPLPELEHGRGKRVLGEPVTAAVCDPLAAGLDERVAGRAEGELVDDEERERLALDIDALPERLRGHEDGIDLLAEVLEQALAGCLALDQDRERDPRDRPLGELVEGAIGSREHEGAPARGPAQGDDLVGDPRVVAGRARLRERSGDVDKRLLAVVVRRGERDLARVFQPEAVPEEPRLERRRDEH
jgi:hypothetical protein